MGQSLLAASDTVPREAELHSMHGYFLHPVISTGQIMYHVKHLRDGSLISCFHHVCNTECRGS